MIQLIWVSGEGPSPFLNSVASAIKCLWVYSVLTHAGQSNGLCVMSPIKAQRLALAIPRKVQISWETHVSTEKGESDGECYQESYHKLEYHGERDVSVQQNKDDRRFHECWFIPRHPLKNLRLQAFKTFINLRARARLASRIILWKDCVMQLLLMMKNMSRERNERRGVAHTYFSLSLPAKPWPYLPLKQMSSHTERERERKREDEIDWRWW